MTSKKYFVYGTLMQPEIIEALGMRVTSSFPTIMEECTLYKSDSGRFPFLVETFDPRDSVKGLVITLELLDETRNVTVDDILDYYEGAYGPHPLYHRQEKDGVVFYLANRGNAHVIRQLTPDNMIGGDWNEFRSKA